MFNSIVNRIWKWQFGYPVEPELYQLNASTPVKEETKEVLANLAKIYEKDSELCNYIVKISDQIDLVESAAYQYDYNEDIQANGFWTYLELVGKFSKLVLMSAKNGDVEKDKVLDVFKVSFFCVFLCWTQCFAFSKVPVVGH